jgi:hypothetical protein
MGSMDLLLHVVISVVSSLLVCGASAVWLDRRGARHLARLGERVRLQDDAVSAHGSGVARATATATAAALEVQAMASTVHDRLNTHAKAINTQSARLSSLGFALVRGGALPAWALLLDKKSGRPPPGAVGEALAAVERSADVPRDVEDRIVGPVLAQPGTPPSKLARLERTIEEMRAQGSLDPANARLLERWEREAMRMRAEAEADARSLHRAQLSGAELAGDVTLESAPSPVTPEPPEPPPEERLTWEDATRVFGGENVAAALDGAQQEQPRPSPARTAAELQARRGKAPGGPMPLLAALTTARTDADARPTMEMPNRPPASPRRPAPTLSSVSNGPRLVADPVAQRWHALCDHARDVGLAADHCLTSQECTVTGCTCSCDGCRRAVTLFDQATREVTGARA